MAQKTVIFNYLNIARSKRFERNVIRLMPSEVETVELYSYNFKRTSGYGHYVKQLTLFVNEQLILLSEVTNCSPDYDAYSDLESGTRSCDNYVKRLVLDMISKNTNTIKSQILEHED